MCLPFRTVFGASGDLAKKKVRHSNPSPPMTGDRRTAGCDQDGCAMSTVPSTRRLRDVAYLEGRRLSRPSYHMPLALMRESVNSTSYRYRIMHIS